MYAVSIGEYVKVKNPTTGKAYRCKKRTKYVSSDEHAIAESAVDVLRQAGKGMRFSGMEEFGSAHDYWNDGHECPEDGSVSDECERLELEACADWIEKRIPNLRKDESEELHLGLPESFTSFSITGK
ncbi:hypothetical protein [Streptomyces atratus]|uniref:hypothetical protein n=1 Tax=Streptomyces atratus TaxID=1893 RepID=UPI0036461318